MVMVFLQSTAQTYKFKNIRYADPPVRWSPPQAPSRNTTIQGGSYGPICYQAPPKWARTTYINNMTVSQFSQPQSEDCLFLDVVVPKAALAAYSPISVQRPLPVMVWIPGGEFTTGSKDPYESTGLMERGDNKYIFVGMNYRVGAFGWLGGPLLRSQGCVSNVGFLDQVAALKWVQKYIHLFGGDAEQVTILGESAGASSVTHHLTAYGGIGNPGLFQRAIAQSPGHFPKLDKGLMDQTFVNLAQEVGCYKDGDAKDELLRCLREVPSTDLAKANVDIVGKSAYGQFTYGPVVDGPFMTENPQILFRQGLLDKSVLMMTSHNSNEGLSFVPPNITTDAAFSRMVRSSLSAASRETIDYIVSDLYPKSDFPDNETRSQSFAVEMGGFFCSVSWCADAFAGRTYNYIFSFNPGTHGQDLPYTFWNGKVGQQQDGMIMTPNVESPTAAGNIQKYIANFVAKGDPNDGHLPKMPLFGQQGLQLVIDNDGTDLSPVEDKMVKRCRW